MNDMPKKRMCVTVREDLVEWIEKQLETGLYATKSHAVERALILLREKKCMHAKHPHSLASLIVKCMHTLFFYTYMYVTAITTLIHYLSYGD